MAKIAFSKLAGKAPPVTNVIKINDNQVEVLSYLPIEDKLNLVDVTLQQSWDNGIINPILLDMNFYLNIIFKYTNISFTDKQREDKGKLFDIVKNTNVLNCVLAAIPTEEYEELAEYLSETEKLLIEKSRAFAPQLKEFMEVLPIKMQEAAEIAKNFDPEKFKNVIAFAQAGNGNRPVE